MRSRFLALTALTALTGLLVIASARADEDDDPFPATDALAPLSTLPDLPPLSDLPPFDAPTPTPTPTPAPASAPAPAPAPTSILVPAAPSATLGQYDEYRRAIGAFSIDPAPVSAADYQRCIAAGKCTRPSCAAPATGPVICVDQSQAQSYCASLGARLPTEDEWEHAAREAVHLGIHGTSDTHAEWTASPYCYFCGKDDQVIRGGPMRNPGRRGWRSPKTSEDDLGFRCAR